MDIPRKGREKERLEITDYLCNVTRKDKAVPGQNEKRHANSKMKEGQICTNHFSGAERIFKDSVSKITEIPACPPLNTKHGV